MAASLLSGYALLVSYLCRIRACLLRNFLTASLLVALYLLSSFLFVAPAFAGVIYEVSFDDQLPVVLFMYEEQDELYLERGDIPEGYADLARVNFLPKYDIVGCSDCVRLSDFSRYVAHPRESTVSVALDRDYYPVQSIAFDGFQPSDVPYSNGFALQVPFTASYSSLSANQSRFSPEPENRTRTSIFFTRPSLSLGQFGVLWSGFRYREIDDGGQLDVENIRLDTYIEKHFTSNLSTLIIGETATRSDINDSSLPVTGVRLYRNFEIEPDVQNSPSYDYLTFIERPSIIEIYQNSELIRREQIDQPGRLRLENFQPSANGRVRLFVTDASGVDRVLDADFVVNRQNIGKGNWDYDLSLGYRRIADETYEGDYAAAARTSFGITNTMTLGLFTEGTSTRSDSELIGIANRAYNLGGNLLWTTKAGSFDFTSKWAGSSEGDSGRSVLFSYRHAVRVTERDALSFSGTLISEKDYFSAAGLERDLSGYLASANYGRRILSGFASLSKTLDVTTRTVGFNYRPGKLRLQGSISKVDNVSPLFLLSLNYRFAGSHTAGTGASYRKSPHASGQYASVSGVSSENKLTYSARFTRDIEDSLRGFNGYLSHGGRYVSSSYFIRTNAIDRQQLWTVSSGIGVAGAGPWYIGPGLGRRTSLISIQSDKPRTAVFVQGRRYITNRSGNVTARGSVFRESRVNLDLNDTDFDALPERTSVAYRAFPGTSAAIQFEALAPAGFIFIENIEENTLVTINGKATLYYDFGAYSENLTLGENTVLVGEDTYTFHLYSLKEVLPVIHLNEKHRAK